MTDRGHHRDRRGDTVGATEPFDIDRALSAIAEAIRPFPKAALWELYDEGHRSVFEQLVACLISVRTRDEVTVIAARRLFGRAREPEAVSALAPGEIASLIQPTTFAEAKARQIETIAGRAVTEFDGRLPGDYEVLTSFAGIGPKCANLVLGIACGQPRIGVDIHVHRVTHRWGYAVTRTPEQTLAVLEAKLPQEHWIAINRLLVPFGKHICTGVRPRCSTCPVRAMCQRVGVTTHR